jgi:hypothetical protein
MQEKELSRSDEQAHTRRKAGPQATVSSQHCANRTLDDFLKAYGESFRTVRRSPRLEWAKRRGGPGAAEPHGQSNATQYVEPGNYAWICIMNVPDGIPHVIKTGMARPFTVRGPTTPQTAPSASVVIRNSVQQWPDPKVKGQYLANWATNREGKDAVFIRSRLRHLSYERVGT